MNLEILSCEIKSYKIQINEGEEEIARCRIIISHNDLHERPFAFLEDVFVNKNYRKRGYMNQIMDKAFEIVKDNNCYKWVLNSSKPQVQEIYRKKGFKDRGLEMRMNID